MNMCPMQFFKNVSSTEKKQTWNRPDSHICTAWCFLSNPSEFRAVQLCSDSVSWKLHAVLCYVPCWAHVRATIVSFTHQPWLNRKTQSRKSSHEWCTIFILFQLIKKGLTACSLSTPEPKGGGLNDLNLIRLFWLILCSLNCCWTSTTVILKKLEHNGKSWEHQKAATLF